MKQELEHLGIVELGMTARRLRMGSASGGDAPPVSDGGAASAAGGSGLRAALAGVNASPQLTAALRAIVYIVLIAACNAAILYLTNAAPAWLALYNAVLIGALRAIEGIIDALAKGGGQGGQ